MEDRGYFFPPPSSPDAIEWDGLPMGITNVITRTKGRTSVSDKALDRDLQRRDQILARAIGHTRECGPPLCRQDVIIHDIRVLALIIDRLPEGLSLDLKNYGDFLAKG